MFAAAWDESRRAAWREAAAMIKGVLRHCTQMVIDRQFVDSHGQSEVAFACCNHLGFRLLPRLNALHQQKVALGLRAG